MGYDNVVLVVADTLRAKNLPSYGFEEETTEFLKNQRSVAGYYSNSPWTVPSHATLFSGQLPSEHGATTQNTFFEGANELVRTFKQNNYRAVGISENGLLNPSLGFGEQFDEFEDYEEWSLEASSWNEIWKKDSNYKNRVEKYADFIRLLAQNKDFQSLKALKDYIDPRLKEDYNPTKSRLTIQKSLDVLDQDKNNFLFVNLMPVHAKYTFEEEQKEIFLPEMTDEEIRIVTKFDTLTEYLESDISNEKLFADREKTYNASIRYLDSLLETFYKEAPDETLFIVIGDHGELIGEYEKHGTRLVDHHFGTFKELIQVPLYIFSKGEDSTIQIEQGLHDHIDLHKFLKEIAEEDSAALRSSNLIRSEYFGKIGFNEQFGLETPEEFEKLFRRKSFSIIDENYKYDLTSELEYLWLQESLTEKNPLDLDDVPEAIKEKGSVLYGWRLEE